MGIHIGIPMGMGMGWVFGYRDGNSVPTAALDSAVGIRIPMGILMGMGMGWVWGQKFRPQAALLPTDVVAASSLSTSRRLVKRFLCKQLYPDIIY